MKTNYYYAVIGPVERSRLDKEYPSGEGGLRSAIQGQFYRMFPDIEFTCSSGWGVTPEMKDEIFYATCDDATKKALIKSFYVENKKIPRALRAWELKFEEELKS